MDEIPNEILIQLFFSLDISDLLNLCQTNKRFSILCQDELLWQQLVGRDFNVFTKPSGLSWKNIYLYLLGDRIRDIPVFLKGINIGSIVVSKSDTIRKVRRFCLSLLRYTYYSNAINVRIVIRGEIQGKEFKIDFQDYEDSQNFCRPELLERISHTGGQYYVGTSHIFLKGPLENFQGICDEILRIEIAQILLPQGWLTFIEK